MRLIAAGGGLIGGLYRAGVEIRLEPGALTYWRMPGSAGVPPSFSFDASTNLAEIDVGYPVPTRIEEDGSEVFGYRDHVIFPLRVTPIDPNGPVHVALHLSYAVCAKLCLPAQGDAMLDLMPAADAQESSANAGNAALAAAEALVPLRLTPPQSQAEVSISRDDTESLPAWRLSFRRGSIGDVFAEGPPGWYFETRKTGHPNEYKLVAVESLQTTPKPAVVLTIKDERQSYELVVDLEAAAAPGKAAAPVPGLFSQSDPR